MIPATPKRKNGGEPTAGFSTAPVWLFLILGGLGYWGGLYLDRNAGGFDERVYAPFHSWDEIVDSNPISPEEVFRKRGQALFHQTCELCHQANGLGQDGKAPPLAGSEWVNAAGPGRIERIVLNGLGGPITVKGQQWNLAMPPWRDNFNDNDVAAILTYIRGEWGNKAPPVKPDQIKVARGEAHPSPMGGEDELKRIPEQ